MHLKTMCFMMWQFLKPNNDPIQLNNIVINNQIYNGSMQLNT